MEKLIEILNKYQEEKGSEIRFKRIDYSDFFVCGDDVGLGYETILSKKFGFIQWLVENDKIDFKKNKLQVLKDIDVRGEVMYDYTLFDKVDGVIMLLSISSSPIEDLLSYLK